MVSIKKLQKYGQYSKCLIIPREWLSRYGNPEQVQVRLGRRRIIIEVVEKETVSDEGA